MQNIIEISSKIQKQNGNIAFLCKITNAKYIIYSNGYIRRETINAKGNRIIYQLNPICKTTGKRILLNSNLQIEKLYNSINNYIKTIEKRNSNIN